MHGLSLLKNARIQRCMNAVAAGTTVQNGSSVDMSNAETVTFVAAFGAITTNAVTGLKAQQSDDDGSADDFDDLEGTLTEIDDGDGNKVLVLEVVRPTKKHVRPVVVRGTANAVIDGVIAVVTHTRVAPVTQGSTVSSSKSVVSPAEGTA
jgi:hypothetical protein